MVYFVKAAKARQVRMSLALAKVFDLEIHVRSSGIRASKTFPTGLYYRLATHRKKTEIERTQADYLITGALLNSGSFHVS